jgi:hypothetical protein
MLPVLTRDFLELSELWDEKTNENLTSAMSLNNFWFPVHSNFLRKELVMPEGDGNYTATSRLGCKVTKMSPECHLPAVF